MILLVSIFIGKIDYPLFYINLFITKTGTKQGQVPFSD